jgi:myogenesis-regulating glycosidase
LTGQINQTKTLTYATEIRQNGFNDSQLEIDDDWETCYGDLDFDKNSNKFPNPSDMVNRLKALVTFHSFQNKFLNLFIHLSSKKGFRVTLWIHPFINIGCPTFDSSTKYLVADDNGLPALTQWWRGTIAGYIDFSRADVADWWSSRVRQLQSNYGIDSFKFDAGESNWLPSCYQLKNTPLEQQPNSYTESYVRNMERFGPMVEVRTAWNSQDVPIFTRMLDKESVWGYQNGLKTLVTSLLLFNIQGYPFILPDMVIRSKMTHSKI